ncbi:MAG TPA: plasmid pRiA4b ORF-3 family protein [Pseudonocardiaceae bacterium]|nr:plasmid pRiA4b ORF-3 family protein [Pseudonocardiaceae bacterium]
MPVQPTIHTIKVSLRNMKPPVWRRLQVPSKTSLAELHHIIQAAMGWEDCHLHQFQVNGRDYADPEHAIEETGDEGCKTLAWMRPGQRFAYWYDFGDDWWHDITVESVGRADPALIYPRCVTGRRSCPPEDCGGPWGFQELMCALGDETHPGHERYREWMQLIGEDDYDPARFDLDEINEALGRRSAGALPA